MEFIENLTTVQDVMDFTDPDIHSAIIQDDLKSVADSEVGDLLFLCISRTYSVILALQNLYHQSK